MAFRIVEPTSRILSWTTAVKADQNSRIVSPEMVLQRSQPSISRSMGET